MVEGTIHSIPMSKKYVREIPDFSTTSDNKATIKVPTGMAVNMIVTSPAKYSSYIHTKSNKNTSIKATIAVVCADMANLCLNIDFELSSKIQTLCKWSSLSSPSNV